MKIAATVANAFWTASNLPAFSRFRTALQNPARSQTKVLRRYIADNSDTAFGRTHDFGKIRSYEDFSRHVPLRTYGEFEPWIARIIRGEPNVLTRVTVTRLLPTSGTTSARKLIPFTTHLQREFNAAIGPWVTDVQRRFPSSLLGPSYWSITPAIKNDQSDSVIPIGFAEDASYLGGARKRLIDAAMAVPGELQHVTDTKVFQYVTLLCLLRQPELRLISVWHPSFLSLLVDALETNWDSLLKDINDGGCQYGAALPPRMRTFLAEELPGRARELAKIDSKSLQAIWPFLQLISCWGDGHAESAIEDLKVRFPGVVIQPKGLLATEAFVTIPFHGFHPVAVCSHFFEFLGEDQKVRLAHELEEGATYEVIVTTGGGLCRYRLGDMVKVTGFINRTPSLRFRGRTGNISDRFGEKLTEPFVAEIISRLTRALCIKLRFALLAPEVDGSSWRYSLFIDGVAPPTLAEHLEASLCENPHYAWCRNIGQLQCAVVRPVKSGYQRFVLREVSNGKRLGDIKPYALSTDTDWASYFNE